MEKKILILFMYLFLLSPALCQTNGYINFMITLDFEPPQYSLLSSNTISINNIGESIEFSAYWTDYELGDYKFSWNITNTFENSSNQEYVNGWSNETRTINNANYEGRSVGWKYYGFDANNNLNTTTIKYFDIISEEPEYSQISQDKDTPAEGEVVNISSYWTDNFEIDHVDILTNETSSWETHDTVNINDVSGWANFTYDTTGHSGETIWWRVNGYDAISTNTISTTHSFSVQ